MKNKLKQAIPAGDLRTVFAASAPVASAPVASAPVASAPEASAPVASAPVASAPVASAPVASAPAPTPQAVLQVVESTVHARRKQWLALLNEYAPGVARKNGDETMAAREVFAAIADGRADKWVFGGNTPLDARQLKAGRAAFVKLHREHCALRFVWDSLGLSHQLLKNLS